VIKINVRVKCKNCNWQGQAAVGKRGFPLGYYKCPICGQDVGRARGRYNYHSERAELKKSKGSD